MSTIAILTNRNIAFRNVRLTIDERKWPLEREVKFRTSKMASKQKKEARKQVFKEEYGDKWSFIESSRRGESYARCTVCSNDFNIAPAVPMMSLLSTSKQPSIEIMQFH